MNTTYRILIYVAIIVACLGFSVFVLINDEKDIMETPKDPTSHFSIVEFNGHSYIRYVESNFTAKDGAVRSNFQLLHDPDCKCKNGAVLLDD
jgi:hypothetical protein